MITKKIKTSKTPKSKTPVNTGDPTYDLIRVFEGKDIGLMTDEEFETRILNLQKLRLIRVSASKKKTALDVILSQIDIDKAKFYLDGLAQSEKCEQIEKKEEEKEKETIKNVPS
jgi:hypothetical protein